MIPDIHLKPWILEEAEKKISAGEYEHIVLLGDLVDEWGQERNVALYNETFDAVIAFVRAHPNTLYCYGNHDVSYRFERLESGFSAYAIDTVVARLADLEDALPGGAAAFIHRVNNVLFSHAGLATSFIAQHFPLAEDIDIDEIVERVNKMGVDELWADNSPIWTRPQDLRYGNKPYPSDMRQVVGHTPVRKTKEYEELLIVDTFSTYQDSTPIGDQSFTWIDTITGDWGVVTDTVC